ncbi:hypothetical protein CK203_036895 [Vitis vinifera]|uniref:Uncharacterized protein n=1 Tax=Vitis vinifera TaxID=29760 RepID=A0A438GXU4_VITVI|nr:hypothetical protein CK203_036895 [Vitis vinifera]
MEALGCLRKDREGGYLSDFKVNSKVDESFKVISSLKINLSKSKFFLVGKVENLNELAFVLDAKESEDEVGTDSKGFPLGWNEFKEKASFSEVAIVCSDKKNGELGVRCFASLNKALLSKWIWRYATER